jgi:hypothetical protein
MQAKIHEYLSQIKKRYAAGISREHSYRGDLQNLLMTVLPDILTTNEPARVKCGAPDYVLTKKDIPVGYIEAKDLGADLNHKSHKEQFNRYKASLDNLIFTNYLDFDFYRDGKFLETISLGTVNGDEVTLKPENFEHFIALIQSFATAEIQSIKSPKKLASMMANKAKLLANVIEIFREHCMLGQRISVTIFNFRNKYVL